MLSREALEGIADGVRGHDCLIVTDDIYEKLLYTTGPFLNIANVAPELVPRLVVVNGMSKAYSMTGWRLGYAAGPKPLIAAMQMIQDQSTSNASSIAQKAAVAALKGPESIFEPDGEGVPGAAGSVRRAGSTRCRACAAACPRARSTCSPTSGLYGAQVQGHADDAARSSCPRSSSTTSGSPRCRARRSARKATCG